jgi:GrpB-like predicted nucleotidyltransferase (UPF0157 family)
VTTSSIELSEYNDDWPLKFSEESTFLKNIIGNWLCGSIEHVGSTSVPGLIAKPVIDIMFGIKSLADAKPSIKVLMDNGYQYAPYKEDVMHWFCKPSAMLRTHHLHLIPYESPLWNDRIQFRDLLRTNQALSDEYATLKKELAIQHKEDRDAYTENKSPFIQRVLNELR